MEYTTTEHFQHIKNNIMEYTTTEHFQHIKNNTNKYNIFLVSIYMCIYINVDIVKIWSFTKLLGVSQWVHSHCTPWYIWNIAKVGVKTPINHIHIPPVQI
jgi:hypothetical protein